MKKKVLGFIALAMSLMATTARADGDIRSIDPCDALGNVIANGTIDDPYIAGQTAYFRIRLENVNSSFTFTRNDLVSPWDWQYQNGVASAVDELTRTIAVRISGKIKKAYVTIADSSMITDSRPWYTDLVCSYTVEPGDFALPMTLVNALGEEAEETDEYVMDSRWKLFAYERESIPTWDTVVSTNTATLRWGSSTVSGIVNDPIAGSIAGKWTTDYSLAQAGLYIKTVDFGKDEYTVPENGKQPVSVNIEGGINTNANYVVRAMIKDGGAVSFENKSGTVTIQNDQAPEVNGTYQYLDLTIPVGSASTSFNVKGNESGSESVVYLFDYKEKISADSIFVNGPSGGLSTNFVTTLVKCEGRADPKITLDVSPSSDLQSTPDSYKVFGGILNVTLSDAYTSDVTVKIGAELVSGTGVDPLGKYIVLSASDKNGYVDGTNMVTFTAAEMEQGTLTKQLYIYILGADDETSAAGKGIKLSPVVEGAVADFYKGGNVSAVVSIAPSKPVIESPTEGYEYPGLAGGIETPFTIKISDDYNNITQPFTVEWLKTGSGTPQKFTVTPNARGEVTVNVKYNPSTVSTNGVLNPYTTRFRVVNAAGVVSDERTVYVTVNPVKKVYAEIEEPADVDDYQETDEEIKVRFKLTDIHEDTLYAFLVPQDEASSNLVTSTAFTKGITISGGDVESSNVARIRLLDGNDDTLPLIYSIVLRTARTWDAGETLEGVYAAEDLELHIYNTAPVITAVNMTGSESLTEHGGTFLGKASVGLGKVFSIDIDDVEADYTNEFTSVWTFTSPSGNTVTHTVKGIADEISLEKTFNISGTYTCSVKVQDKDMSGKNYSEIFNFKVEVRQTPYVFITDKGDGTNHINQITFEEDKAEVGAASIWVKLSTGAPSALDVQLEIVPRGTDGALNIVNKTVSFKAEEFEKQVYINELDGTLNTEQLKGAFDVTATVVTTTPNEEGTPLNEMYQPATTVIRITNSNPVILLPTEDMSSATNQASRNVEFYVKWNISDVPLDLENGLTVRWTSSEAESDVKEFTTATGVFTNMFKYTGAKTLRITVTDKDGGSTYRELHYYVEPSKILKVHPILPYAGGGQLPLSTEYAEADGRGKGRVYAQGTVSVTLHAHEYVYNRSVPDVDVHAFGYKSGQVDDGTLYGGWDVRITKDGNSVAEGDANPEYYVYDSVYDSFFYAWVVMTEDSESGAITGTALVNPINPFDGEVRRTKNIPLPLEMSGDEASPLYPTRIVEAFFSREKYVADNMGDMNNDGIPDYYATINWSLADGTMMPIAEAMTGNAISDGSEGDEGGSASASDLTDVAAWNGTDMDFFPMARSAANPLDPDIKDWGPGLPFEAYREIRGIHEGLNQPGVSEYDLAENEVYALFADFAAAGNAMTDSYEDNYAAATNWATQTGWTPEALNPETGARLNPLKFDTDGDGFDDGWEYFFWYYAKLGAVVNGEWRRLEGRRFDPSSPTLTRRISPEEIVAAFNPHVKRDFTAAWGSDFDNDGLTDFEEYILGTNPISCDTDGDAMAELWKVMNGLSLVSDLNNDGNPDRDFMARCDYAEDTFTVYTFADDSMFALPTKTASAPVLTAAGSTSEVWKVEFANGETGLFATLPAFVSGVTLAGRILASDVVGYSMFSYDGVDYIGAEKTFPAGSAVTSVADATIGMTHAALDATGFSWTDPETLEASTTVKALPLFNYGGDGVTYVPCVTRVDMYANAPVSSGEGDAVALIKIEEKKIVTLIHHQVMCQYGFDPRVAWSRDEYGYVDQRWRKAESVETSGLGATGYATNTVPFTSRDEFLVMQYRMQMRKISDSGERSFTESLLNNGNGYLLPSDGVYSGVGFLERMTTYPNLPVSFVREWYASRSEVSPFDNSTNKTIIAYWTYLEKEKNIHGADTDNDGIPDGWELYVNADPTYMNDATLRDGWAKDGDELNVLQEYAGVDSCNAYTNRFNLAGEMIYPEAETITKNHTGKDTGWWNKFFPTNPYEADTDGDGLADHVEGRSWSGNFWVGANFYGPSTLTFIYGDEETLAKYAEDGKTTCFRGGGLNPCTVDTDGDLLPDAWEYEFAGILFKDGKTDWPLEAADLTAVMAADGKQSALTAESEGHVVRGGMDGTFKGDACYDFDHDGLVNCQEYLVQTLRHLRYDDALTPLMGVDPNTKKFLRFMPFSAWDGTAFHKRCLEAGFTGLGAWQYKDLGYFVRPPHDWDMLAQNEDGIRDCVNYMDSEGAGYRIMLRPSITLPFVGKVQAAGYATTDPRRIDSDYDGMDDYWEIFHGLNPLLGSYADPMGSGEYDWPNSQYDVIATIYGGMVTSWANHWTGWNTKNRPTLDAIKHPWMIGVMECDADGDGLRNDEEALKVNLAKPVNTHTDPTPLWMTDSSGAASFTAQYYSPDPYVWSGFDGNNAEEYPDLFAYPWDDLSLNQRLAADGMGGICRDWMFSFGENEGFDTDHDFRRDSTELTHGVEVASDPQDHSDLDRRQALYFPGWDPVYNAGSAAVSYGGEFRRSPSTEPDLLKQFTVECWVKPDGEQAGVTILERVCSYGPSTLTANKDVIRANFRIGIDANGCVYGLFQGSTEDSATVDVTSPNPLPAGEWSHIAFRFDGGNAYLHINGEFAPVAMKNGIGLLPANGVDGILQDADENILPLIGYRARPCATILGASATAESGLEISENTTWDDYDTDSYFKGWIDEVRIWDGARTAADIHADYKKRYTREDICRLRTNEDASGVYDMWVGGARRNGTGGNSLPPELLQHYSFSTLPGGVDMGHVITEPTGFREGVLNNVRRPNGADLDLYTMVGWWSKTPVRSLVYWDYHIVPWIANTVAHLPFLDGSSPDSQYWSSGYAGVNPATTLNIAEYEFPNTANPYPYYFYHRDRYNRLILLEAIENGMSNSVSTASASVYNKCMFDMRSGFVGTSDLVPLGLAFAKRDTDYWDGQGAMDAWTQTKSSALDSADSNLDGIPDWATRLGFDKESYLRALALGLLPTGESLDAYKSVVDINFDGVPDWWQQMYGVKGSAQNDADKDGLADYAEYLIAEIFDLDGTNNISPLLSKSDSVEFDYFRREGKLYFGQMFSDHDFMEDHLEREYSEIGAVPAYYDSHLDVDENGWSAWSDLRSKYAMGYEISNSGTVKTNVIYQTYTCYDHYQTDLEEVLNDANSHTHELIETDFTIQGKGHWFTEEGYTSWHDDYYGTGFIKYYLFTPVYSKTHLYKGHPVPEVSMTVRYNGVAAFAGQTLAVEAYTGADLNQPDAVFHVANGSDRNVNTLTFKYPSAGYLREGANTFVVYVAPPTNNASVVSVPAVMGVVRDVDVGWDKVEFEVELTDASPVSKRVALSNASTNATSKIYVYRYAVDGLLTPPSTLDYGPVLVKGVAGRTYLHEGDFLGADGFDIDWAGFQDAVLDNRTVIAGRLNVTSVTYRAYFNEVDLSQAEIVTNMPFIEVVRNFDMTRVNPVPVAPGADSTIFYGARPTFRWTNASDNYTAFAIQVKSGSTVVWNSGTQLAPPRNSRGEYEWTAPLHAGDMTARGHVFANTENYTWSVTMYNSKFQSNSWSAERAFRINIYDENEVNNAGYYGLKAKVRYFGPGTYGTDLKGMIRVEAYDSPDFSGVPAARTFVRDIKGIANSESTVTVSLIGLKQGTYYVRAFIDSDGDNARSVWESWGYACSRGDVDTGAIYAPTPFKIGDGIEPPTALVYIEDTDVDQDALPDVWEYDEADGAEDFLLVKGPMENDEDGYISVNPDLMDSIKRVVSGTGGNALLSFASAGTMSSSMTSLMIGADSVEPEIEESTLRITGLSLDGDHVNLTLGAAADDPLDGTVFISNGKATVTIIVYYASSLGGEWKSKEVTETFTIKGDAASTTHSISLSSLGLNSNTGFFKVELKR